MENRVVLVTGGVSGIGKGMVHMFADRGCQVIIFDVQDDKGETLAKELCDQGKKVPRNSKRLMRKRLKTFITAFRK